MPTYQQAKRPYDAPEDASPTGAVSFDQRLAANAQTAKASAGRAVQAVGSAYNAAQRGLDREANAAATAGTALNPSESLAGQYAKAGMARKNLGSNAGVQENLGAGASPWDAAMARVAGGKQLATGQSMYAPRENDVANAQKSQTDAMARALAEKQALDAVAKRRADKAAEAQPELEYRAQQAQQQYDSLIASGWTPEAAIGQMSTENRAAWNAWKTQNGRGDYVTDAPAGG